MTDADWRHGLGLLVLLAVAGVALLAGGSPVPGSTVPETASPADDPTAPTPTVGPGEGDRDGGTDDQSGDGATDAVTEDGVGERTPSPPFHFWIDDIEECGNTCRDVTATARNNADSTQTAITVHVEITTDGDRVWTGEDDVGTLEPGAAYTETHRVDVGYRDGLRIQANDGWITITTTIESADERVVHESEEQIA